MPAGNNVRRKTFSTPAVSHEPGPEFDIDIPGARVETFRCVPVPPPAVLAAMLNSIQFGGEGEAQFRISGILAFLSGVVADSVWEKDPEQVEGEDEKWTLVPVDDLDRWQTLVRDRNKQIPIEVLGEVVGWLSEHYLERPTAAP